MCPDEKSAVYRPVEWKYENALIVITDLMSLNSYRKRSRLLTVVWALGSGCWALFNIGLELLSKKVRLKYNLARF